MKKRRRHKIFYTVHNPGYWWTKKGWSKECTAPCSNTRYFRTMGKAMRHATTLPSGTTLTRYFFVKGKRKAEDWVKR